MKDFSSQYNILNTLMNKVAYTPPGADPSAMGQPPMDPSAMGLPPGVDPSAMGLPPGVDPSAMGLPPGVDPSAMGLPPGVDPSMMGGQPPMDPSAMGQPPMDPSAMGGQLPPDPSMAGAPLTPEAMPPATPSDALTVSKADLLDILQEAGMSGINEASGTNMDTRLASLESTVSAIADKLGISPNSDEIPVDSNTSLLPPEQLGKTASAVDLYKRNVTGDTEYLLHNLKAVFTYTG